MITAITKSNTPAPTAPITASMFWLVFSDSNSTKCKLLYIEKNGNSVETKKRADLFVLSKIKASKILSTGEYCAFINICWTPIFVAFLKLLSRSTIFAYITG